MCGVCMFHECYKSNLSHACDKPRLLQATLLQHPESHNMRHLPWCSSSSNDIELGVLAKSHAVAAGMSGFLFAVQRGAFFLALFFGKGLKNLSTDALRCVCLQPSFFYFVARSKASLMVEASFGVTSSIKHYFGIML